MSPENHILIEAYRKKVGRLFSPEDLKAERIVSEILMPINWRLQSIYSDGKSTSALASLKDFLSRADEEVTPAGLTAIFLKSFIHDKVLAPSVKNSMAKEDDAMQFIVWHDYSHGFSHSLSMILIAKETEEEKMDLFRCAIQDLGQDREGLDPKILFGLALIGTQFETEATRLLLEDQTGEKVLTWFRDELEKAKNDPRFFGHFIPEFVIAGADLARDMHRVVYPQAASLYDKV